MTTALLPYRDPALPVDERVADLLARMTRAEKVAQLGAFWAFEIIGEGGLDPDRLAAIEMLMYPPGESLLGGLLGSVTASVSFSAGGLSLDASAGAAVKALKRTDAPIVLFFWGPGRIVPVRITSLSIEEQQYSPLLYPIRAKATILTTGGASQLFATNLYPSDITGDGYAMAHRAGARLVNMEFMQAGVSVVAPFVNLFGNYLWAAAPRLTDKDGREFVRDYLPPGLPLEETQYLSGSVVVLRQMPERFQQSEHCPAVAAAPQHAVGSARLFDPEVIEQPGRGIEQQLSR